MDNGLQLVKGFFGDVNHLEDPEGVMRTEHLQNHYLRDRPSHAVKFENYLFYDTGAYEDGNGDGVGRYDGFGSLSGKGSGWRWFLINVGCFSKRCGFQ
jgi:hypothetical protein